MIFCIFTSDCSYLDSTLLCWCFRCWSCLCGGELQDLFNSLLGEYYVCIGLEIHKFADISAILADNLSSTLNAGSYISTWGRRRLPWGMDVYPPWCRLENFNIHPGAQTSTTERGCPPPVVDIYLGGTMSTRRPRPILDVYAPR